MKSIITNTAAILTMTAGSAFAGIGADVTENGWLWMLFLGFGALIVVFQLVPCVILGVTMLKALFSKAAPESAAADANGTAKS
jgi:hypothetical protein